MNRWLIGGMVPVLALGTGMILSPSPLWRAVLFAGLLLVLAFLVRSLATLQTKNSPSQDTSPEDVSLPILPAQDAPLPEGCGEHGGTGPAIATMREEIERVRAMVRNLQQANTGGDSLQAMAESQKHYITTMISDSNLMHVNANQAYAIADNIAGNANQAFELSGQVQTKVATLADELGESLKETEFLIEESQKISGILEMMNQIAASTHVLSINASIVAARAGVHGRAFDVVSKEIRALAQNTAASLANIESIVHEIQDRIARVAERTRDSSLRILGEKDSLLSVAGSLQGVILAVEVIRSVSSLSSEKALKLEQDAAEVSRSLDLFASSVRRDDTLALAGDIYALLDRLESHLEACTC